MQLKGANIIAHIGEVISYLRDQKTMAIILVEQYFEFAFGLASFISTTFYSFGENFSEINSHDRRASQTLE